MTPTRDGAEVRNSGEEGERDSGRPPVDVRLRPVYAR